MFKYVPVLRYRQEERGVLKNTSLTTKTLPLIEIIMDKPRSDMKGDYQSIHVDSFMKLKIPIMIDIPLYFPLTGRTKTDIRNFLGPIQQNPLLRIKRLEQLKNADNIIPVSSYNPRENYIKNSLFNEAKELRKSFQRIAFRIFAQGFEDSLSDVTKTISPKDILIFDLDAAPYSNGVLDYYALINKMKKLKKCYTVIVRSAIPNSVTNVGLKDNQIIVDADNGLLKFYKSQGFDAFGDYAGIKKDAITAGGTVSPGLIFYSWHKNCYVGYRYKARNLDAFKDHIIPTLTKSKYWSLYGSNHHNLCPGCKTILAIKADKESGKSQGKWKRITIMHYLHTMEEFL